jgi:acyl carrier protein
MVWAKLSAERGEMNEALSTRDQIRAFVMPMAEMVGVGSFSDEESLTAAGIVDSFALFRLVSFLEETFSVSISDDEIAIENFDSIDRIHRLLTSKLELPAGDR